MIKPSDTVQGVLDPVGWNPLVILSTSLDSNRDNLFGCKKAHLEILIAITPSIRCDPWIAKTGWLPWVMNSSPCSITLAVDVGRWHERVTRSYRSNIHQWSLLNIIFWNHAFDWRTVVFFIHLFFLLCMRVLSLRGVKSKGCQEKKQYFSLSHL